MLYASVFQTLGTQNFNPEIDFALFALFALNSVVSSTTH